VKASYAVLVLVAFAFFASAASSQEVEEPAKKARPVDVSGAWCGVLHDQIYGDGQLNVSVQQHGNSLRGTWSDDLGGFGRFTGKIHGDALTLIFRNAASKCKLAVNGALVDDTGSVSQLVEKL
jgi:hypothetical protein